MVGPRRSRISRYNKIVRRWARTHNKVQVGGTICRIKAAPLSCQSYTQEGQNSGAG